MNSEIRHSERKTFFKKIRSGQEHQNPDAEMSFIDHLEELRWHLVRAVLAWLIFVILIFVYSDWVYDNVIYAPSQSHFVTYGFLCNLSHSIGLGESLCMPPINLSLLGTTVSAPFMAAISISMWGGFILAFPYLCWEVWRFVMPALSTKEKKYFRGSLFWVSICFFLGAAFGYYLLAPFTFNFLANFKLGTTATYQYMPTLNDYISSLTNLVMGCGLAFELPVFAYVLAKVGIVDASILRSSRKYAAVIILLVAAIITPSPDWTSQLLVAIPLLLLYEISVYIVARVDKVKEEEEKQWE